MRTVAGADGVGTVDSRTELVKPSLASSNSIGCVSASRVVDDDDADKCADSFVSSCLIAVTFEASAN